MAEFDDLVPAGSGSPASYAGAFDDLIPQKKFSTGGAFDDLVPGAEIKNDAVPRSSEELGAQNFTGTQKAMADVPGVIARSILAKVKNPDEQKVAARLIADTFSKPKATPGTVAQIGAATAAPFTYAGRVIEGGVKDVAEGWGGQNKLGVPFENATAALATPTDLKSPLPIDSDIEQGQEELRNTGHPIYAAGPDVATGLAKMVPKIAAIGLAPESLPAQMGASGALFGLDDEGNFSVKDAALMSLMPGVGAASRKLVGQAIAAGIRNGARGLDSATVQKALMTGGDQLALNAYTLATQTPELVELHQKDPAKFWQTIGANIGQNLAFAALPHGEEAPIMGKDAAEANAAAIRALSVKSTPAELTTGEAQGRRAVNLGGAGRFSDLVPNQSKPGYFQRAEPTPPTPAAPAIVPPVENQAAIPQVQTGSGRPADPDPTIAYTPDGQIDIIETQKNRMMRDNAASAATSETPAPAPTIAEKAAANPNATPTMADLAAMVQEIKSANPFAPKTETKPSEPTVKSASVEQPSPPEAATAPAAPAASKAERPLSETPSSVIPAQATSKVEPRPERVGRDTTARDAWDENYGNMRRGGRTHNDDGTPYQPTILDETMSKINNLINAASDKDQASLDAFGRYTPTMSGNAVREMIDAGWVWDDAQKRMVNPKDPSAKPSSYWQKKSVTPKVNEIPARETQPATARGSQFREGQRVTVTLSKAGKEHMARIYQVQPDGSATVMLTGEKDFRTVRADQLRPTKTDAARQAKADEIASLDKGQQARVKADAAEFDRLVEDYAPQLQWAPAEAYDRNTATQGEGITNARLREQAKENAFRAIGFDGQTNSILDRAEAMPLLEQHIRAQFPDDTSIDKRRALEKFDSGEPEPTSAEKQQRQADDAKIVTRISSQNSRVPELKNIRAAGAAGKTEVTGQDRSNRASANQLQNAGVSGRGGNTGRGTLGASGQRTLRELERIFGVRIIPVESSDGSAAPFNGWKDRRSNVMLVDRRNPMPLLTIAGHELGHHLELTHPELYKEMTARLIPLIKGLADYQKRMEKLKYPDLSDENARRELVSDFIGDCFKDPAFLQKLARQEPQIFKRFAKLATAWLDKLIAKAKTLTGYGVEQHLGDLERARDIVADVLTRFAREQVTGIREEVEPHAAAAPADDWQNFSKKKGGQESESDQRLRGGESFRAELQSEGASGRPTFNTDRQPAGELYKTVPTGTFQDAFGEGKFLMRPDGRLVSVADHEPAAAEITGGKYNPDDNWLDRHSSKLADAGWARLVKDGSTLYVTWKTNPTQMRELKNLAIENHLSLVDDNHGAGRVIYEPEGQFSRKPDVEEKTSDKLKSLQFHAEGSARTAISIREQVKRDIVNLERHKSEMSGAQIDDERRRIAGFEREATQLENQSRRLRQQADEELARLNKQPDQFQLLSRKAQDDSGDFFSAPESVEQQKARLAEETRQTNEAKAKQAMLDKAQRRLTGEDIDTTGDIFAHDRTNRIDKAGQGSLFSRKEEARRDEIEKLPAIEIKSGAIDRETAERLYKDLAPATTPEGKTVEFVHGISGKLVRHAHNDILLRSIPQFGELLKNSLNVGSDLESNPKRGSMIKQFTQYVGKLRADGRENFIRFTVQELKDERNQLHDARVTDAEIIRASEARPPESRRPATNTLQGSDKRLRDIYHGVNEGENPPALFSRKKPDDKGLDLFGWGDAQHAGEPPAKTAEELAKEPDRITPELSPKPPETSRAGQVFDFGEKIGGARKDIARKLGPRASAEVKPKDDRPGWMRRYEVKPEEARSAWGSSRGPTGKFTVVDKITGRQSGSFDTEAEAKASIPLVEVARNHRVGMMRDRQPVKSDIETARAATQHIEQEAAKIQQLRSANADLLQKKALTDRYRKEVAKGTIQPDILTNLETAGMILNSTDYTKAQGIEKQINDITNAPLPDWVKAAAKPQGKFGIYRMVGDYKRPLVKGGFESEEAAQRYMATNPEEIINHKFEFPTVPWLDRINREGPEYRKGDVKPDQFQKTFGFRGGEFGNWNQGTEGQAALNYAYDGLMDLSRLLNLPPKALSLNGELAIAFGARGTGGEGAGAAHYEPDYRVINLTKIRGAGSLAHEWLHALDHYLGAFPTMGEGKHVLASATRVSPTVRGEVRTAFDNLVKSLSKHESTVEVTPAEQQQQKAKLEKYTREAIKEIRDAFVRYPEYKKKPAPTAEQLAQFDAIAEKLVTQNQGKPEWKYTMAAVTPVSRRGSMSGRYTFPAMEELNTLFKSVTGSSFARKDNYLGDALFARVNEMQRVRDKMAEATPQTRTTAKRTQYYDDARDIDMLRGEDYWSIPEEMLARAFASHIYDRAGGETTQYLVHAADNKFYKGIGLKPYPEGAERMRINANFDQLFNTLKVLGDGEPAPFEGLEPGALFSRKDSADEYLGGDDEAKPERERGAAEVKADLAQAQTDLQAKLSSRGKAAPKDEKQSIALATARYRELRDELLHHPDYAAEQLDAQHDAVTEANAMLKPLGKSVHPEDFPNPNELREKLTPEQFQRFQELQSRIEQTHLELAAMPKKLVARVYTEMQDDGRLPKSSPVDHEAGRTLDQVTDYMRKNGVDSPKLTLAERFNLAGRAADLIQNVKTAWQKAMLKARALTQAAVESYKAPPKDDDFRHVIKSWIFADQRTGLANHNFIKELVARVPNQDRRKALSVWLDADGDNSLLKFQEQTVPVEYQNIWKIAQTLSPGEKALALKIKEDFAKKLDDGQKVGIIDQGREDYGVPQRWKMKPQIESDISGERQGTPGNPFAKLDSRNPFFSFQRETPSYFEGIMAKGVPENLDIAHLVATYDQAFHKSLSSRAMIGALRDAKAKDGLPVVKISGSASVKNSPDGKTYFVDSHTHNASDVAADGRPYEKVDHSALRGWELKMKDASGNPIFVKGDMLVHPDHAAYLKNELANSGLREVPLVGGLMKTQAFLKASKLSASAFHLFTIGEHMASHLVNPFTGGFKIDLKQGDQALLVRNGLELGMGGPQEAFSEGLAMHGGLFNQIPFLGDYSAKLGDWMFRDYIPTIMMKVGLKALEANRKRYGDKLTPDQVAELTAQQMNTAGGLLNKRLEGSDGNFWHQLGANKTLMDLNRLNLMAPQFLEARARVIGQALKPYGAEQRRLLLIQAGVLYVGARVLNQLLDDDPHWTDNPFSVVYHGRAYSIRTIVGDMWHLLSDPASFAAGRLAPITKIGIEDGIMGGRDLRTGARKDVPIDTQSKSFRMAQNIVMDLVNWITPIPFESALPGSQGRDQTAAGMALSSVGVGSRKFSAVGQIHDLAAQFNRNNPDKAAQAFQAKRDNNTFGHSDYSKLDNLLDAGDTAGAQKEYQALLDEGKKPSTIEARYDRTIPFTGNQDREMQFRASLTPEQQKLYARAREEQQARQKAFSNLVNK